MHLQSFEKVQLLPVNQSFSKHLFLKLLQNMEGGGALQYEICINEDKLLQKNKGSRKRKENIQNSKNCYRLLSLALRRVNVLIV